MAESSRYSIAGWVGEDNPTFRQIRMAGVGLLYSAPTYAAPARLSVRAVPLNRLVSHTRKPRRVRTAYLKPCRIMRGCWFYGNVDRELNSAGIFRSRGRFERRNGTRCVPYLATETLTLNSAEEGHTLPDVG
jgi:hypothetical protein